MRLNTTIQVLDIVAYDGFLDAPHLSLPLGAGIAGVVAETGRTECIDDVDADPRFLAAENDMQALMAVPLKTAEGRMMGVVNLSDPVTKSVFDADQVRAVESFVRTTPFPFTP